MSEAIPVIPWFAPDRPSDAITDPAVVVGGTGLLGEFFSRAACGKTSGALYLAAPYVMETMAKAVPALQAMPWELIDVIIVSRSPRDARAAARVLSGYSLKSLLVSVNRRLHAKAYVHLTPSGAGSALIGSHNLSASGARHNHEAGVLFLSYSGPRLIQAIGGIREEIESLAFSGYVLIDTCAGPTNRTA